MSRTRAVLAALLTAFVAVVTLLAAPRASSADPNTAPSNTAEAQAAAKAAAARVAHLQTAVRSQYTALTKASAAAERADAQYHHQLDLLQRAKLSAQLAKIAADRAQATYEAAELRLGRLLAVQYQSGGAAENAGELLIADDPTQMIVMADAQAQLGRYSADLVDRAQAARDASDAANAAEHNTLQNVESATANVRKARDAAAATYGMTQQALIKLRAELGKAQATQQTA